MDELSVFHNDPPSPCTPRQSPPAMGEAEMFIETPPCPRPVKKRRLESSSYRAVKFLLSMIDEINEVFMEEKRMKKSTEEALEAERQRKTRILMSFRNDVCLSR
ncbi:hypothetical protein PIB30_064574 [Stylosanthes scabra]|uniref:Uncharacterized protein n=1 Tax=Stylosanthes scabra TaxID=79078 RepID=A0ABU6TNX7_9FABA|nr:hypothetical protein [Stylosanthes scabra]